MLCGSAEHHHLCSPYQSRCAACTQANLCLNSFCRLKSLVTYYGSKTCLRSMHTNAHDVSQTAGEDVCREVAAVADQVVVAARSWKNPEWAHDPKPYGPRNNISRRGMVSALHPDGRVEFAQVGRCLLHGVRIVASSLLCCCHTLAAYRVTVGWWRWAQMQRVGTHSTRLCV